MNDYNAPEMMRWYVSNVLSTREMFAGNMIKRYDFIQKQGAVNLEDVYLVPEYSSFVKVVRTDGDDVRLENLSDASSTSFTEASYAHVLGLPLFHREGSGKNDGFLDQLTAHRNGLTDMCTAYGEKMWAFPEIESNNRVNHKDVWLYYDVVCGVYGVDERAQVAQYFVNNVGDANTVETRKLIREGRLIYRGDWS